MLEMKNEPNNQIGLQEANYKQYANELYKTTAQFGINKERTYLLLSILIGNSEASIKKEFSQKKIPAKYIEAIRYILMASSLYIDYFALLLPFYRDQDGKESLIKIKIDLLKRNKKQPYWDKWIQLVEMKLSSYYEKNIVLEYFKKEAENLNTSLEETVSSIHTTLCLKSGFIKKNYFDLYTKIDRRIQIYERVYRSIFYLTYYSWIFSFIRHYKHSLSESSLKEKVRKICFTQVENYIKELKELTDEKLEEDIYLRKTVRLLDLYYSGNRSMIDHEGNFSTLSKVQRESFLKQSREILNKMSPLPEDELLYRVWFKYYYFIYLQKLVEHEIHNQNYLEVSEKIRTALESLEDIQRTCRGGFNRIRIKCVYHKRYLEFIGNSIEAYLLEKETISHFGISNIKFPNHNSFSYDDHFIETIEWMKKEKKNLLLKF